MLFALNLKLENKKTKGERKIKQIRKVDIIVHRNTALITIKNKLKKGQPRKYKIPI